MNFFRTAYGGSLVGRASSRAVAALPCRAKAGSSGASPHRLGTRGTRPSGRAFTLVEVAISLAIIGIALVAIIGVLPLGMNVQRDNREATIINQDATIFIEAIRGGARGLDDLTNYVYAITNYWTEFAANGSILKANNDGYSFQGSQITKPIPGPPFFPLTNGLRIIGLLSTPQLTTDLPGLVPVNNLLNGGYSNHVVAYVRSLSGPAVEKPPQDNALIQADSFTYVIYSVNASMAASIPSLWQAQSYIAGDQVYYPPPPNSTLWQATATTSSTDVPGSGATPTPWTHNVYSKQLAANLHELRLTFLWPVRPNGKLGTGRQTYRALVSGQIMQTNSIGQPLYFYQSQSFTNTP
jgi:prepilin-type N-terminal cleavage/methylation domain-containing protein